MQHWLAIITPSKSKGIRRKKLNPAIEICIVMLCRWSCCCNHEYSCSLTQVPPVATLLPPTVVVPPTTEQPWSFHSVPFWASMADRQADPLSASSNCVLVRSFVIRAFSRNVAKRVSTRKALLGGNIDIMVNNYTDQQIRITMHLQRVGIETYIGPCVDRYNRTRTILRNYKQRWKQSKGTMEATKSEIRQIVSTFHIQCFTVVFTVPLY